METLSFILSAVATLGLTGNTLWMHRENKRLKQAEVHKADLENQFAIAERYQKLYEMTEVKAGQQSGKIDRLYADIAKLRNQKNKYVEEIARMKVELIELQFKSCSRRNCTQREPRTGF